MYSSCYAFLFILLITFSPHSTLADRTHADTCGLSCVYLVSTASFTDYNATIAAELEYYGIYCSSADFAKTFALCLEQYCHNPSQLYSSISNEYCGAIGLANFDGITYADAVQAGKLNSVSYASLNLTDPVTTPFTVDKDTFRLWYRTVNEFYRQLDLGTTYGGALLAYFGGFIVLAILRNVVIALMTSSFHSSSFLTKRPTRATRMFQRFVMYPATFSASHLTRPRILGITFTIPNRAQTLLVSGYIFLTIILSCSAWTNVTFAENVWWPDDQVAQFQRYLADRSGVMAVSQVPFVFLFAGRNNILLWLTGWSYQTFNVYHKWTGRVMWALAFIHAITYTVTSIRYGDLVEEFAETYWRWGVVAITTGAFAIFFGIHSFRKLAYEVFLIFHIILVAIFIAALWWHLESLGWMQYVYASIAIWAFDRIVRLLRIIYFNAGWSTRTTAEMSVVDGNSDAMLFLKVSTVRKATATPGQYFFLHIGTIAPWSAHPFTVLEQDVDGNYILVARVHKGLTEKLYNRALTISSVQAPNSTPDQEASREVPTCTIRAGIDGLYGKSSPLQLYDTVVLIAGGVGITGCYPYLSYLSQRPGRVTRHVKLMWVVRQESNTNWLRPRLERSMRDLDSNLAMDVEIYVTSSSEIAEKGTFHVNVDRARVSELSTSISGKDEAGHDVSEKNNVPAKPSNKSEKRISLISTPRTDESPIQTYFGRPNLAEMVRQNVESAPSSVAILLCGPASMADDVRYQVHHNIERARGRLDYFEEALEW